MLLRSFNAIYKKNYFQMKLLDFAQRMRVERMSGYISVYGISQE